MYLIGEIMAICRMIDKDGKCLITISQPLTNPGSHALFLY
jgi:hypothetical protein